ncbi:MAG TPA: cytochrome c biogenesis protein CcdA [Solirubrobacterales bacterium]|nr:cytochrome c biogenesis protein CcdA [Solirubrobacterales bacterium]
MNEVGIPVAFLAGIVSFASPCCLPLVPGYVSYMVVTNPDGGVAPRRTAFLHALSFVVGFTIVFIAIWASVGLIGYLFRDYVGLLRELGGAVLVFMGLHVAGLISVSALYREKRLPMGSSGEPERERNPSYVRSAMLGVIFSAGWTPCIGPILGGIIGLASVSASVAQGSFLLLVYALGLGVPFVLVALGATAVSDRLGWLRRHQAAVDAITGAMLVAIGFLMITNTFGRLSGTLPVVEL